MHSKFSQTMTLRRSALALAIVLNVTGASTALAHNAPGTATGPVLRYNQVVSGAQQQAAVASAADGNSIAVWYSQPEWGMGPAGVRARRLDGSGAPVGADIVVNSITQAGDLYRPSVATDTDGNFVVVWTAAGTQLYSPYHVFLRRFDRNGMALAPQQQIDLDLPESGSAVVARSGDGRFVVAWNAYPSTGAEIRARRYDAAGSALGSDIVVATRTTGYAGPSLRVATDDAGNFTVVWTHDHSNGADFDVFRRRFDAYGVALGPAQRVNASYAGSQRIADIAMDGAGNSVVVWDSYISRYDSRVVGQRYGANGLAAGGEFTLAIKQSYPTEEPTQPTVAMARATGDFSATWQRRSDTIFTRSYAANGTARGAEVLVSDGVFGARYPRIGIDADGDVSVVWQNSESSASNDTGVVGRRLAGYGSIDLAARLTATVESTAAPGVVNYRIEAENLQMPSPQRGVGTASGIVAVLTPPPGGVVLDAIGTNWQCDITLPSPRCSYAGVVAPGLRSEALQIRVGGVAAGAAQASMRVSGGQYDAQAGNDIAAAEVIVP